jgi:threonine/homoserine/homoserine lactone efflux protein
MFSLSEFMVFSIACWALILSPGPDMIYVITRGVAQGRLAGILSAAGVIAGTLVHTLFAACGLTIILQTSALAFMVVKFAGAAYLIYLGVQAFFSKDLLRLNGDRQPVGNRRIFLQGLMSNVLNPKIAIFFLAFLPQFVDPGQSGARPAHDRLGANLRRLWPDVSNSLGLVRGQGGGLAASPTGHQPEDQICDRERTGGVGPAAGGQRT